MEGLSCSLLPPSLQLHGAWVSPSAALSLWLSMVAHFHSVWSISNGRLWLLEIPISWSVFRACHSMSLFPITLFFFPLPLCQHSSRVGEWRPFPTLWLSFRLWRFFPYKSLVPDSVLRSTSQRTSASFQKSTYCQTDNSTQSLEWRASQDSDVPHWL